MEKDGDKKMQVEKEKSKMKLLGNIFNIPAYGSSTFNSALAFLLLGNSGCMRY